MNLSAQQMAVVNAPIGEAIQVLASAGSGKTRVISERIRHILNSNKRDRVIALTFTNKAAEEMNSRLEDIDDVGERCWIGTIHSVAQRVLNQYGHTIGLPQELQIYERDEDRKAVFLQSLRDAGIDLKAMFEGSGGTARVDSSRVVQNYMEQFSIIKRGLLGEEEIKDKYSGELGFWEIYTAYQDALLQSGGIDFDDILVYAHKVLLDQPWCGDIYRTRYKHICVDEAQDLNKAQYEFIKVLCGDKARSLFMVGDPNQMIYGFNGSSHKYLCENFVNEFSPLIFSLTQNFRSSRSVIELANKLKPGSQDVTSFALVGYKEIRALQDEEQEADWVCQSIKGFLDLKIHPEIEGDIALDKMVIIGRNRFVFGALERKLLELNIPFSLRRGERLAEPDSTFGRVLDLAIRIRINPKDWVDGKKLCGALKISFPVTWGDSDLLMSFSRLAKTSSIPFPTLQSELLEYVHNLDLEEPNFLKLFAYFNSVLKSLGPKDTSERDEELELSLRELAEFQRSWSVFKRKGLGGSLAAFRNAMALGQLIEDFDPKGLTLSTVHTMKGLEKDIVFLIGMCEGVFPDYRAKSSLQINEERNNAFVAVTRARRWIYITYPKMRKMPWGDTKYQHPSRFLNEMML
ncbi:DNA helicase-2 / ATP-dependent DNA helicase PcrA [Pseudomonas grimontii]|uniref:DNA 3'-5' helicase n=1 Tax=Pseudomonas grimontii TaxID=129847 RepID=A0A1H1B7Z4_9PSED|nr:ATP-dependent helicase [Pseudomonas grimontii]TWR63637.1 ATP-dependent helicase [Pseudomonas grimontii]SDQ47526.1 DNA helicase-2 / ATP-dependent DNA helicase PcrA [Pseudomonas grimontii]